MLFTEARFFAYFFIVFSVYWALHSNTIRKNWLLLASYLFYGLWNWKLLALIGGSSLFNYWIGVRLGELCNEKDRHRIAIGSIVVNLGVLGFFKYMNFFVSSFETLMPAWADFPTLNIILPIGISFFTFHSISYTIDVYRKDYPPCYSMRDYFLFVAFFPQLVAGPIMRPTWLLPQMSGARSFPWDRVKYLLAVFALGFFKKAVVADSVAPFVDQLFADPVHYSLAATYIGVSAYAVQIYCDFSGYTDMAMGVAGLLGYRLIRNFNTPYLAVSIQDFWRRWHISLSSWLRDYLYIGLGGSRAGEWKTHRNLLITMLLGGLWHGAAWTFVVWGGLHGVAQSVERLYRKVPKGRWWVQSSRLSAVLGWALTLYFVCGAWILFRAQSFDVALVVLKKYLFLDLGGGHTLPLSLAGILPLLIGTELYYVKRVKTSEPRNSSPIQWIGLGFAYGAAWSVMLALLPLASRPFIYFQF